MKLKTVRAAQGVQWLRAGCRVFLRQPLAYTALLALCGIGAWVLSELPLVGPLLALVLTPAVNVAFMLATREVLTGHAPGPRLLLAPLRDPLHRKRLLQAGTAYATTMVVALLMAHVLDGGQLTESMLAVAEGRSSPEAVQQDPGFLFAVLLRLGLLSLVSLMFWHVPALVCWGRMTVGKALFANAVGCWNARGAFLVYGLTWFGLLMLFVLLMRTVLAVFGLTDHPMATTQAVVPMAMLASTVFYASLYFSFVDCFDLSDGDAAGTAATADSGSAT